MLIEDWGTIAYPEATAQQMGRVETVAGGGDERLIFCNHPPVVTLGRGSSEDDLSGWSGETLETSRGGKATYHGPSQIVIYPILDLKNDHRTFKARDLHGYMRALEVATCEALQAIGIKDAEARTTKIDDLSLTGVWVGEKKIASIGIAVRKWVTYHGVAINVERDPLAFTGINPCGFQTSVMTCVEELLGEATRAELTAALKNSFLRI